MISPSSPSSPLQESAEARPQVLDADAASAVRPVLRSRAELLAALEGFRIDDDAHPVWPFVRRLARDHRWDSAYAHRVVVEYKRFLALAMLADHVVCPSEQVDQAWHLHLLYTRSYWQRLCKGVLGRDLHHTPSKGGAIEHRRYRELYERTLASYQRVFGHSAPTDIWPAPARRFDADQEVVHVRKADAIILDRSLLPVGLWILAVAAVGLVLFR